MHPFLALPSANPGAFRATQEGLMEKRDAWEKVTPPWKKFPRLLFFLSPKFLRAGSCSKAMGKRGGSSRWLARQTMTREVDNRCYVKNITSYVKKITSYVKKFT